MKQVTYTGPADPLDGTTNVQVEVDDKTHDFPKGVEVEVSDAVAARLEKEDLSGHAFEIKDAPGETKPPTSPAGQKPADTSGQAGEKS